MPQTVKTPEEKLNDALLTFAHVVNNDMEVIVRALKQARDIELTMLVDDLVRYRNAWKDASQAFLESIGKQESTRGDIHEGCGGRWEADPKIPMYADRCNKCGEGRA